MTDTDGLSRARAAAEAIDDPETNHEALQDLSLSLEEVVETYDEAFQAAVREDENAISLAADYHRALDGLARDLEDFPQMASLHGQVTALWDDLQVLAKVTDPEARRRTVRTRLKDHQPLITRLRRVMQQGERP